VRGGGGWGWCWSCQCPSLHELWAWRFSFDGWVVFLSHLPCCNRVQIPKTKSWSNACSWKICYACGGRGEGRYLNEMGRIWSLSHFRHTLCWHEEGIVQLWRSVDVLVIVITLTPWLNYFVSSCEGRLMRWTSKGHQDHWRFTSIIWIFQGRAFHWGNACPRSSNMVILYLNLRENVLESRL